MDAQIWLGGSQFVETDDWKEVLDYKEYQQKEELPFYSISATVGPYKSDEYISRVKNIIKKYDDFCCRDSESYNILKAIGNKIHWAPDMVFSYTTQNNRKQRQVCVSLINIEKRFGYKLGNLYAEIIVDYIDYFISKNYKIVLLSLCIDQGDTKCCKKIKKKVSDSCKVEIVEYKKLNTILDVFGSSEYVIGTRYHSIVLGILFGAKILPISYESKTANLLRDIGKKGYSLDELWNIPISEATFWKFKKEEIESLRDKSEKQYQAIDSFIYG